MYDKIHYKLKKKYTHKISSLRLYAKAILKIEYM